MTVKSQQRDHERVAASDAAAPAPVLLPSSATGSFSPVPVAGLVSAHVHRSRGVDDELGGSRVPAEAQSILARRKGRGSALPDAIARRMEAGFGTPLSHVRVHADSEADLLTREMQSTAFTLGSDIYFSRGSYAPGTGGGQRLLAHELAHVAAGHTATGAGGGLTIGHAADPAEAQADAMADSVLRNMRARDNIELRRSNLRRSAARSGSR